MNRFTVLLAAAGLSTLAHGTAAAAEGGVYTCAPNMPTSEVLTCVPAPPGTTVPAHPAAVPASTGPDHREIAAEDDDAPPAVAPIPVPVVVYAPAPPPAPSAEPTLTGRTHNWLVPTGELLRAGDAEVMLHEFIYTDIAIGLTDRVELNVTTPILPAFGSVGLRVGLLPRSSSFRLVVGASLWVPLLAEADADENVISGTITAAYQTERLNLHASLSFATTTSSDDDDTALGVVSVGATYRVGKKVALMGELVQLTAGDHDSSEQIAMSALGLKFLGARTDVDLGLLFPQDTSTGSTDSDGDSYDDDDGPQALPMISVTHRF